MVLHRGTRQGDRISGIDLLRRAVNFRFLVLYILRFIEDKIAELHLLKKSKIAAQKCVGRNDNIALEIEMDLLVSFESVMHFNGQVRRKLFNLVFPVSQQRRRCDNENRKCQFLLLFQTLQKGERLEGFSQSHIVRQDAAETETLQKSEPVQPLLLIAAKGRFQTA
jgi:hypothetical protein